MPKVFIFGSYRYFFYAGDRNEPPHIHVESGDKIAKFWLEPVRLQKSIGFSRTEIDHILKVINLHHKQFLEAWSEYFGI